MVTPVTPSVPPTVALVVTLRLLPTATVPVKLAAEEIVWPLIRPEVIVLAPRARAPVEVIAPELIVPMLTKLPDASILWVPAAAPVLIPVVPLSVVPVIVLAVVIVPKPEAIDPEASAPVPVIAVVTASFTSTRAAFLPSSKLNSLVSTITPLKTKVVPLLPVRVIAPVVLPIEVVLAAVAPMLVVPVIVSPPVPCIRPAPAVSPTDVISPEALTVVMPDSAP